MDGVDVLRATEAALNDVMSWASASSALRVRSRLSVS